MNRPNIECPYCKSTDTYTWQIARANIYDDEVYKGVKKEFGNKAGLLTTCDNIIYRCKCNSCGKPFSAAVMVEIKSKTIITAETIEQLLHLRVSDKKNKAD